jgi:hypothetical protein
MYFQIVKQNQSFPYDPVIEIKVAIEFVIDYTQSSVNSRDPEKRKYLHQSQLC